MDWNALKSIFLGIVVLEWMERGEGGVNPKIYVPLLHRAAIIARRRGKSWAYGVSPAQKCPWGRGGGGGGDGGGDDGVRMNGSDGGRRRRRSTKEIIISEWLHTHSTTTQRLQRVKTSENVVGSTTSTTYTYRDTHLLCTSQYYRLLLPHFYG